MFRTIMQKEAVSGTQGESEKMKTRMMIEREEEEREVERAGEKEVERRGDSGASNMK